MLVPCNYVHAAYGYTEDFIADDCIADLDQQLAYLGPINFLLYINESTFNPKGFNEEATHRNSVLINIQGMASIPSWIRYQILAGQVHDAFTFA